MSSRLPTTRSSRSASASMVRRKLARCRRRPKVTSSDSRLVTDALIPASGVRRSCDTACRMPVRSCVGLRPGPRPRPRPAAAGPTPTATASWSAKALQHARSPGRRAGGRRRTRTVRPSSVRVWRTPSPGLEGGRSPLAASVGPVVGVVQLQDRDGVQSEHGPELVAAARAAGRARWPGPAADRASASASARARTASADRRATRSTSAGPRPSRPPRTPRRASDVLRVADGEGPVRGREEAVGQRTPPATAATTPGSSPPSAPTPTTRPSTSSSAVVMPEVVAERQRERHAAPAGRPPAAPRPARRRRGPAAGCGAGARRRPPPVGASGPEMTWTSMAPGLAQQPVDHRAARSARWRRVRRLAPSTIWVACSVRATATSVAATSSPTTSR